MSETAARRIVLLIMDGWGLREQRDDNAVALANTPVVDRLWGEFPHTTLNTSGECVGLPPGQMGNSEVGHLNIGAGRVVFQDIMRINNAIADKSFYENDALLEAVNAVKNGGTLHVMGLLSDGGVHSTQAHLNALLELARRHGVADVQLHLFTDGRDTSPTGGIDYLQRLERSIADKGVGRVATLVGRYYAMDRDHRWERTHKAYDALTQGVGEVAADCRAALSASYDRGVTDEFVEPIIIGDDGDTTSRVKDGDAIIFYNFRADRTRQLTRAFTEEGFDGFERSVTPKVTFVCMTPYHESFDLPAAFPRAHMVDILGEVSAANDRKGFRIAETEKYAHVTYFFNGGEEKPFSGEDRVLIPSPKVATYDLQPQMSAHEVADQLIDALRENRHDYVVCNFANPDMVGHTGDLQAAITAVETTDTSVGRVLEALDLSVDAVIVTADHGNAETMVDPTSGGPHTAHTTNPVPCILVDRHYKGELITGGSLRDIAPTMCNYMGIAVPEEMTGRDLRADR